MPRLIQQQGNHDYDILFEQFSDKKYEPDGGVLMITHGIGPIKPSLSSHPYSTYNGGTELCGFSFVKLQLIREGVIMFQLLP